MTALAIAIVVLIVWYFSSVVIYVLIAVVLSLIGSPIVKWLNKRKIGKKNIPNGLSAFIALLMIVMVFAGFILFLVPLITSEVKSISQIDFQGVMNYYKDYLDQIEVFLRRFDIIEANSTILVSIESHLKEVISLSTFSYGINNLLSATGSLFIAIFSILFLTFFFLRDPKMFPGFIRGITPEKHKKEIKHVMEKTQYFLARYFLGLLGELISMMTIITLGLHILGVENALTIGFIAGLMNIIPYLGPIIGTIFGIIIAVVTVLSQGLYDQVLLVALEVVAVILGANLLDNMVLQPLIYSSSVKAHPVEIFLVIIMAGSIAGIPGMILAIPSYTVIRVIAKEFLSKFRIVQDWTKNI
jgi:predicted PurR-regulated permease PerM